jgi:hypothetical protein
MPIKPIYSKDTQGAFEVVHQTLSSRALGTGFSLPALCKADPATLSLAMPHRVELLTLDDLRGKATPGKEKAACWRFLVLRRDEPIAAATAFEAEDGPFAFGDLSEGPFVKGTADAVHRAEALAEVQNGQFEAVLLVVPARYVVALWLQDVASGGADGRFGDADLLIAIPPSNPALDPREPMRPAPFLEAVRRAR